MSRDPAVHPRIHRLDLGILHLPDWHPRAADRIAPLHAYAIEHPDGVILFDCGCGADSAMINEDYRPRINGLEQALGDTGLALADVKAVVLSHLHFDHCGQRNAVAGRPTYVQRAEIEAARAPNYTVAEWARIPAADLRIVNGDEQIAPGLTIVASPGHTPGHQSLVVRGGGTTSLIGGQCCYCAKGFAASEVEADNLFDESWETVAMDTLRKLSALKPDRLFLAHDTAVWSGPR